MKVNKDPHQVVLSREMYDALMGWAKVGVEESYSYEHDELTPVSKIKWHARKFNANLHLERQAEVKEELRLIKEGKEKLFKLLKEQTGNSVWYRHLTERADSNRLAVFYPVMVMCRATKDKQLVTVRHQNGYRSHVSLDRLYLKLPDGAAFWETGPWRGKATFDDAKERKSFPFSVR